MPVGELSVRRRTGIGRGGKGGNTPSHATFVELELSETSTKTAHVVRL